MSVQIAPDKAAIAIARDMANAIVELREDPGDWLLAAREVCVTLDLRPAECIPLGACSLDMVCYGIVAVAFKLGRTEDEVRDAFREDTDPLQDISAVG